MTKKYYKIYISLFFSTSSFRSQTSVFPTSMTFIICPNFPILMLHPSSNSLNTFVTFFHFLQMPWLGMSLRTSPPSSMIPNFLFLNLPNLHFDLLRVASTYCCKHCHLHLCVIVMNVITSMPYNKMFTYKITLSL